MHFGSSELSNVHARVRRPAGEQNGTRTCLGTAQKDDQTKILHVQAALVAPIDREEAKSEDFSKTSLRHINLQLYKLSSFFELVFKERTHMSQGGICASEKHWFGAFLIWRLFAAQMAISSIKFYSLS